MAAYTLPGFQQLDSLAVEANGNVCAATVINGGITVIETHGCDDALSDCRPVDHQYLFRRSRLARRLDYGRADRPPVSRPMAATRACAWLSMPESDRALPRATLWNGMLSSSDRVPRV